MSENKEQANLSETPPKQQKKLKFSYFEPVAGMIIAIAATIIFFFFPQIIGVFFIGGRVIPTFETEVIRSLWIPIFLWALLRIGVEVAFLVERRYTRRLALISVIGYVLTAIVTFIIFLSDRIVHWEYVEFIHTRFDNLAAWFANVIAKPNLIILVFMMLILIMESINVIRKGNKAKEKEEEEELDAEAVVLAIDPDNAGAEEPVAETEEPVAEAEEPVAEAEEPVAEAE